MFARLFNRLSIILAPVFIVLSLIILFNTYFNQELDLLIKSVKIDQKQDYYINLHTTKAIKTTTSVNLIYEDGTTETALWDLNQKNLQLQASEPNRLEYLKISSPESIQETSLKNNNYPINIWSPEIKLIESYSKPEYDYLVDATGMFWFVVSSRPERNQYLRISLTVYDSNGNIILNELELSSPKSNSRYPTIQILADGKVQILWSSYLEDFDRKVIYYTSFTAIDGKLVQGSTNQISDGNISMERPIFLSNSSPSNAFLVQLNSNNQLGYALYNVESNSINQINQNFFSKYDLIDDIIFLDDQHGNYLVIWTEANEDENKLVLSKFSHQGDLLIEPQKYMA